MAPPNLNGRRVLVVEDELLIVMLIEEVLQGLGCIVVGPAAKLPDAIRLAADEVLDAAILDLRVRGGLTIPVAEQLAARNIPFLLASGYGDWALPREFQGRTRLDKPFTPEELELGIALLFEGNSNRDA